MVVCFVCVRPNRYDMTRFRMCFLTRFDTSEKASQSISLDRNNQ